MIQSAGHFKQTQNSAIIEAILNILISIIFVKLFGLVGVSIAATVAMIYRTSYFVLYLSNHILRRSVKKTIKNIIVDVVSCVIMISSTAWIKLKSATYIDWLIMAILIFAICAIEVAIVNLIFYKDNICGVIRKGRRQ